MDLARLNILVERLRKESIGEPKRIAEKDAFEYQEESAKVVAVLKLVRAAHGISALDVLCRAGLFIDFGAITRCVMDCLDEIHFLLEDYPKTSGNVDLLVKSFFASTIDGYLDDDTPPVPTKKIRAAAVRYLKGKHDDATQKVMENIYKTFCGYVHANYAHIMEVYNEHTQDFNLAGVPSDAQKAKRAQYVEVMGSNVLLAAAFIAQTLELRHLSQEILKAVD
jgi:hypothetical protein